MFGSAAFRATNRAGGRGATAPVGPLRPSLPGPAGTKQAHRHRAWREAAQAADRTNLYYLILF